MEEHEHERVAERIRTNLADVRDRIAAAEQRAGRPAGAVTLVAVTKTCPNVWIPPLIRAGVRDLGENYPQELWGKVQALSDFSLGVRWHLIGHLQTNKVKRTLPLVGVIHSVDRLKLLEAIVKESAPGASIPRLLLQVNLSEEASKHGWDRAGLLADAEAIAAWSQQAPIVGLMTMAALGTDPAFARPVFAKLRELRDELAPKLGVPLPELSMGMSGDFVTAVEEGATMVRVGSALFEGLVRPEA